MLPDSLILRMSLLYPSLTRVHIIFYLGVVPRPRCVNLESRVGGLQVLWYLLCVLTQLLSPFFQGVRVVSVEDRCGQRATETGDHLDR